MFVVRVLSVSPFGFAFSSDEPGCGGGLTEPAAAICAMDGEAERQLMADRDEAAQRDPAERRPASATGRKRAAFSPSADTGK